MNSYFVDSSIEGKKNEVYLRETREAINLM